MIGPVTDLKGGDGDLNLEIIYIALDFMDPPLNFKVFDVLIRSVTVYRSYTWF